MQKNTLSSSVYGIFYRINHILGHKSSLSKFKKIETVSRIFSDLNALRLDINYKEKKNCKNTDSWRLNNTLLSNKKVTEEIRRQIKRFLKTKENESTTQNLSDSGKPF